MAGNKNASVASQKAIKKLHRKVFEWIKESKWGKFCKSIWIKNFGTQVILQIGMQLYQYTEFIARALFPVEKTNNIKIKITRHRVIGD